MRLPFRPHLAETTLADLADGLDRASLDARDREHLESCAACERLLEGHALAARLLASPWELVDASATTAATTSAAPPATRPALRVGSVPGGYRVRGHMGPAPLRGSPVLAALLLLVAVALIASAGLLVGGRQDPRPALVPAVVPPTTPRETTLADAPAASPTYPPGSCTGIEDMAHRTHAVSGGGWAPPAVPPGAAADATPGLIAGWGQNGSAVEGRSPLFDVFTVDPATGASSLLRITSFQRGSAQSSILDWSPDGSALVAAWFDRTTGCSEVFVIGRDSTVVRPLPTTRAHQNDYPAWSPDSSQIAMVRWETSPSGHVELVQRDGSQPVDLGTICETCHPGRPYWSPDGTWIAVDYEDFRTPDTTVDSLGVAFHRPSGGDWILRPSSNGSGFGIIGWLDDGRLLLEQDVATGRNRLFTISPDVPGETAVPFPAGVPVSLSPDRSSLLFLTRRPDGDVSQDTLHVLDIATGRSHVLRNGSPWPDTAGWLWSPDGKAIAITVGAEQPAMAGDRAGLWIVPVDGSGPTRVGPTGLDISSWQSAWK